MRIAPDSTWLWGNGSRLTFATLTAKPYPPAKPQRPWNGDGLTYYPATGCKRVAPEGTILGHPAGLQGNTSGLSVTHDVELGPVVVDMQTGDRWPL